MNSLKANKASILIVDDEAMVRQLLVDMLSDEYDCVAVGSAKEALAAFDSKHFNLVVSDINLGEMSGVEMIPHISAIAKDTVMVMISGAQTVDNAIDAMRVGAFDYLKKPFEYDHVLASVRRALSHQSLLVSKREHEEELEKLVVLRTDQINHLAYHDGLTDLPNRALFEDRLGQIVLTAGDDTKTAVLLVSIDRLRRIRDTLGNTHANRILVESAERIKACVEPDITVGRIEGDIFALLLPDTLPDHAIRVAAEIVHRLSSQFVVDSESVFIDANVGISLYPDNGLDSQTLLRNAGAALSRAQETGGSATQFFTTDLNEIAAKRLTLESDLRGALDRGEFAIHYQPKLSIRSGQVTGMEALVRWTHPTLGPISPADFIPIAEEIGLIDSLGEWITRQACSESKSWIEEGFDLRLAVNLSGIQLQHPDITKTISQILVETGFEPHRLNLEVTESSIMQNTKASITALRDLRDLGMTTAIDDFGTGYSCLSSLKELPIDILKIDQSFVRDITRNPDDTALVTSIIHLAHDLGIRVVAEGVETPGQLELLRQLGCDEWQGYLASKPLPAEAFTSFLDRSNRSRAVSNNSILYSEEDVASSYSIRDRYREKGQGVLLARRSS